MTLAENERSEVNEIQASETKCTEACWSNYPLSKANGDSWIKLKAIGIRFQNRYFIFRRFICRKEKFV